MQREMFSAACEHFCLPKPTIPHTGDVGTNYRLASSLTIY